MSTIWSRRDRNRSPAPLSFALSVALRIFRSSPSGRVSHAKRFKSICKKIALTSQLLAKKNAINNDFRLKISLLRIIHGWPCNRLKIYSVTIFLISPVALSITDIFLINRRRYQRRYAITVAHLSHWFLASLTHFFASCRTNFQGDYNLPWSHRRWIKPPKHQLSNEFFALVKALFVHYFFSPPLPIRHAIMIIAISSGHD